MILSAAYKTLRDQCYDANFNTLPLLGTLKTQFFFNSQITISVSSFFHFKLKGKYAWN